MAKFEIINGKLIVDTVASDVSEEIVVKAVTAGMAPKPDGNNKHEVTIDSKVLRRKLLEIAKHIHRGKLTIDDEALSKVFETFNKHQKFDPWHDDAKFGETYNLKDDIESALDNLTNAQLKHIRDYIKGLK